jgi:hypothetical protein
MPLITCVECGREKVSSTGICPKCNNAPIGHPCAHCGVAIPQSALSCPICGLRQREKIAAENAAHQAQIDHKNALMRQALIKVSDGLRCRICPGRLPECNWITDKGERAVEVESSDEKFCSSVSDIDNAGVLKSMFRIFSNYEKALVNPLPPNRTCYFANIAWPSCGECHSWGWCPWCRNAYPFPRAWYSETVEGWRLTGRNNYQVYTVKAQSCHSCMSKAKAQLRQYHRKR